MLKVRACGNYDPELFSEEAIQVIIYSEDVCSLPIVDIFWPMFYVRTPTVTLQR